MEAKKINHQDKKGEKLSPRKILAITGLFVLANLTASCLGKNGTPDQYGPTLFPEATRLFSGREQTMIAKTPGMIEDLNKDHEALATQFAGYKRTSTPDAGYLPPAGNNCEILNLDISKVDPYLEGVNDKERRKLNPEDYYLIADISAPHKEIPYGTITINEEEVPYYIGPGRNVTLSGSAKGDKIIAQCPDSGNNGKGIIDMIKEIEEKLLKK